MLAEKIIQDDLSVREVENLVKKTMANIDENTEKNKSKQQVKYSVSKDVLRLQETLSDQLGASVSIKANANGAGVLKINYASLDQLDEILAKIAR